MKTLYISNFNQNNCILQCKITFSYIFFFNEMTFWNHTDYHRLRNGIFLNYQLIVIYRYHQKSTKELKSLKKIIYNFHNQMYSRCRNFPIRNYSFLRYPITYAIFMLIILHSKQDSPAQYFIFLKMSVHTLIKPLYVVISDTGRLFFLEIFF